MWNLPLAHDSTVPQPPGHEPLVLLDRALDHLDHQLHLLVVVEVVGQAHQLVHVATLATVPPLGDLVELGTAEVLGCLGEVDVGHGVDGGGMVEGILPDLSMLGKAARVFDLLKWVPRAPGIARRRPLPSSSGAHEHSHSREVRDVVVRDRMAIPELLVKVDQSLLLGRDALLVLDEGFEVADGGGALGFEGDGLAFGELHDDLHVLVARVVLVVVGVGVGVGAGIVTIVGVGIVGVVTIVGVVVATVVVVVVTVVVVARVLVALVAVLRLLLALVLNPKDETGQGVLRLALARALDDPLLLLLQLLEDSLFGVREGRLTAMVQGEPYLIL